MWLLLAMLCLMTPVYNSLPQLSVEFGQTTEWASITGRLQETGVHTAQDKFNELNGYVISKRNQVDLHHHINQGNRKGTLLKISNFTFATPVHSDRDSVNTDKTAVSQNFDSTSPKKSVSIKRQRNKLNTSKDNSMRTEGIKTIERTKPNDDFRRKEVMYKSQRGKRSVDVPTTDPTTSTTVQRGATNLDELHIVVESILPQVGEMLQGQSVDEKSNIQVILKNMTDELSKAKLNTLRALSLIYLFYYYKNTYLEKKVAHLESTLRIRENTLLNYSADMMTALNQITSMIYSSMDDFDHQWPEGTYALLKPSTGCPLRPTQNWMEGFYQIHTESTSGVNLDSLSENSHLTSPAKLLIDSQHFMNISFCVKHKRQDSERPWPKGSYCINRKDGCPGGFSNGSIHIDQEDTDYLGYRGGVLPEHESQIHTLSFCCRGDASPSIPIKLPFFTPFYLYRFDGTCQNVFGMYTKEEFIYIDTENSDNSDTLAFPHPDARIKNVNITLCYYESMIAY